MHFVVYGAGAIGGVVGARLAQHGHDVTLIARGRHFESLRSDGLTIESPDSVARLRLPVVDHPSKITWSDVSVVLLAMKTQDTLAAVDALAAVAPPTTPIFCMQNGVENERIALRWFERVYGAFIYCPVSYLTPGVVQAWYAPVTGIYDLGRYPTGTDETAEEVAAAFRKSTFRSDVRADIMRMKYRKLLMNLGNAIDALAGHPGRESGLLERARHEGTDCFNAAGIPFVAVDDPSARAREMDLQVRQIGDQTHPGGSTWQSLARHAGTSEVDFLNGEIVLLGRAYGVPTPVNEALQWLTREAVRKGSAPGDMSADELAAAVEHRASQARALNLTHR